jgi:putative glutamine amidotransferase
VDRRSARPLIGVSGPDEGGWPAWFFTRLMLWRCGARALRLTPARSGDVSELDGLIIGGGADVTEPLSDALEEEDEGELEPAGTVSGEHETIASKEERRRWLHVLLAPLILLIRWLGSRRGHGVDTARDQLEQRLLLEADQRGLPVLGICRGAQLMSVVSGGQIVRDVNTLYEERPRLYTVLPRRRVRLERQTLLRRVLGCDHALVNSLHHHAVQSVGRGFTVAAREAEGVVQAVERIYPVLWWGVQWHPEYLPQSALQLELMRFWVGVCRAHAGQRGRALQPAPLARERALHELERTPRQR